MGHAERYGRLRLQHKSRSVCRRRLWRSHVKSVHDFQYENGGILGVIPRECWILYVYDTQQAQIIMGKSGNTGGSLFFSHRYERQDICLLQ